MTRTTENRIDIAAAAVSLAAEATDLETRVDELRRQLVDIDERMRAVSDALHRLPPVQRP
ncbi:hypothetical protein [Streptomyces sp. NBC_00872]|uniref:hypothetical protein n=1 Tax=Streptomyces sp. NBC_00872 TaxID=2903686 RepID=UPI00386911BE|nr:hypothetical protein OG214_06010 [Streptomyces sp. NBC_00872]